MKKHFLLLLQINVHTSLSPAGLLGILEKRLAWMRPSVTEGLALLWSRKGT